MNPVYLLESGRRKCKIGVTDPVSMKFTTRFLILAGCSCLGLFVLTPPTGAASPTKQTESVADKLHTPAESSAERESILDGLRRHWQTVRNPDDGKTYRGKISFHVGYLN